MSEGSLPVSTEDEGQGRNLLAAICHSCDLWNQTRVGVESVKGGSAPAITHRTFAFRLSEHET